MKKYQYYFILIILLVGLTLRLYSLPLTIQFSGDAGRDLSVAFEILQGKNYPLTGPPTSLGWFSLGPFVYYLWALILWVGHYNPEAIIFFTIFSDVAVILY